MKSKWAMTVALLAFVAISVVWVVYHDLASARPTEAIALDDSLVIGIHAAVAPTPPIHNTPASSSPSAYVTVYYFHGTSRCVSCVTLESYTRETVEREFAEDLKAGRIIFRAINVEFGANQHYIQDYQLKTRSVIVALYRDGQQVRWENLQEVWTLLNSKGRFVQYVEERVDGFLREVR